MKPNFNRKLWLSFLGCMVLASIQAFSQTYVNKNWQTTYGKDSVVDSVRWGNSCVFDSFGHLFVAGSRIMTGGKSGILLVKINPGGDTAWTRTYHYDVGNNDFAVRIATDMTTAVYIACASYTATGKWDYMLLKYNLSGTFQWSQRYNGPVYDDDIPTAIAIDGGGDPVITGSSIGIGSHEDWYTIKYNSSGVVQWAKRYDKNNLQDVPAGVGIGPFDDVYVTGGTTDATGNREITTIEYDHVTGNQTAYNRQSTTATSLDMGLGIKVDKSNNVVYVTGNMADNGANFMITTIKYNSGLTQQWIEKYAGDSLYNEARGIDVDAGGNVLVTGFKNNSGGGGRSLALLKYSSSGSLLWSDNYWQNTRDSIEPVALDHDGKGNIYIATTVCRRPDYSMATIIMYDSSGSIKWDKHIYADTGGTATASDIKVLLNGNAYITGTTGSIGNLNYFIANYQSLHKVDSDFVVNDTPRYVKNELLIRFSPNTVITNSINNTGKNFGSPSDFIDPEFVALMEDSLGFSLSDSKVLKVFQGITSSDSLSLSRLGDTVSVPDFWNLLLVTLPPGHNLDSASKHLSHLTPEIRYVEKNVFSMPYIGANDPKYSLQVSLHHTPDQFINDDYAVYADSAWDLETGKNFVKLGIVDGGIDFLRKDFRMDTSKSFKYLGDTKIAGGHDYL